MRAARIARPGEILIEEMADQRPGPGEVRIRVAACGVCGTDVHIYRGEYLGDYPIIPGHEFAGTIEEVVAGVSRFAFGDRVAVEPNISCSNCEDCLNNRQNFCRNWQAIGVTRSGAMAESVCVPEQAVFSIGELPFDQGAFVEPLSCVIHGIERAEIDLAGRILILGAGPIGLLLLEMALLRGAARITAADRNRSRLERAAAAGASETVDDTGALPAEGFDTVIDATGAPPVMAATVDLVRPGGTILLFGVPPSESRMTVEPFKIFRKGLKLVSSFTSLRNSYQAVRLLTSGRIAVGNLISHRLPLEELEQGIELIERGTDDVMKVLIKP